MQHYRQGDVLIQRVDAMPEKLIKSKTERGRFVLAEGEATGHAHAVKADPGIEMFEDAAGTLWLRTERDTEVVHEEHDTIPLPPGTYRVIRQREYTPEEIRRVAD